MARGWQRLKRRAWAQRHTRNRSNSNRQRRQRQFRLHHLSATDRAVSSPLDPSDVSPSRLSASALAIATNLAYFKPGGTFEATAAADA